MNKLLKVGLLMLVMSLVLVGCTTNDVNQPETNVSLEEVLNTVKSELGEDYIPSIGIEPEELEMMTELSEDDYEEFLAERPMMSTHIDTIVAVKAKKGNKDIVVDKLNNYREYIVNDSFQYPMNLAKVEASKVVEHNDYVFFLMLGAMENYTEDTTKESQLKFAQDEIQRVEDIIQSFFN